MLKISENNGEEEICLVSPTPGNGLFVTLSAADHLGPWLQISVKLIKIQKFH